VGSPKRRRDDKSDGALHTERHPWRSPESRGGVSNLKQRALQALKATGAFAPFRIANRRKALILMYHRFTNDGHPRATTAESFREQLDYLRARYDLISLSTLANLLNSRGELPPRLASITIDDGYRDAYEVALPVLKQKRVPATLFAVTGFIDGDCWL